MLKVDYIKKIVRNENEISNLKLLLNTSPDIIPRIKTVTNNSYLIEKCFPIEEKDFTPDNFQVIYNFLSENLYEHTDRIFSEGIYKYFFNHFTDEREFKNKSYVPYLLEELEKAMRQLKVCNDKTTTHLLNECKERATPFLKWYPSNGFNLLHGDLHIGNIVKKDERYFLIDYEYVRYGAKELEIANFIISGLIFYGIHKKFTTLKNFTENYLKIFRQLKSFNYNLFLFFLTLSITLYYITALIKNNEKEIIIILRIFEILK